jgi:hypothetical protein
MTGDVGLPGLLGPIGLPGPPGIYLYIYIERERERVICYGKDTVLPALNINDNELMNIRWGHTVGVTVGTRI